MRDDDFSMFESGAMVEYRARTLRQGAAAPAAGQHATRRCTCSGAGSPRPPLRGRWATSRSTRSSNPRRERIPAVVEDARTRALRVMDALEAAVPDGRYLVDEAFTAADIMMGYTLILARRFNVLTPAQLSERQGRIWRASRRTAGVHQSAAVGIDDDVHVSRPERSPQTDRARQAAAHRSARPCARSERRRRPRAKSPCNLLGPIPLPIHLGPRARATCNGTRACARQN